MQEIKEIYEKYHTVVYKYLLCLTKNADTAEDLTQETFYKMMKKIHTFRVDSKISVWLFEIAKNLCMDTLIKKKYKTVSYEELQNTHIEQTKESIENEYINKEEFQEATKNIEKLDELSKKVLYLRVHAEMSFKEIGDALGKTETWARVTFYRAKQKIKGVNENGK